MPPSPFSETLLDAVAAPPAPAFGAVADTLRQRGIMLYIPGLCRGGAERVTANLATAFAAWGFRVTVLTHTLGEGRYVLPDSVEIVDLKARRTLDALPKVVAELRRRRPAVLLSALTNTNAAAAIAVALARVPTRLLVTEHAPPLQRCRFGPDPVKRRLVFALNALLYRGAEVVAVSGGIRRELVDWLHLPPGKVHVIPNPVVTPDYREAMAAPLDDPWYGPGQAPDAGPVILGVGRLVPEKNFPMLIDAVGRVRQRRPVRLLILGEGPEQAALTRHIAERGAGAYVRLPGTVDNPLPYYRRSDLFVLSSNYEGFGNVLVEAMACGTPVVSTDCPSGPMEILEHGGYGVVTPVGDTEAMAAAIERALDTPWDRDRLRRRAADFTVETIARKYLDLIMTLA